MILAVFGAAVSVGGSVVGAAGGAEIAGGGAAGAGFGSAGALAFGGGGLKGVGEAGEGALVLWISESSFAIAWIADGSLERLRIRSCRGGAGAVPWLVCVMQRQT